MIVDELQEQHLATTTKNVLDILFTPGKLREQ